MSIAFSCADCGKNFKVPDDMAGRKAKCSGCGVMMEIPNTVGISERPSSRGRGPAVAKAEDWQEEEPPRKKSAGRRPEDDGEEGDEPVRRRRPKKRKKQKKSGLFVVALLGVGLVVLLGLAGAAGGLVWYFWFNEPDPLKFAPDNTKVVMVFNMEQIEGTRSYEALNRESEGFNNQMGLPGQSASLKKARVSQVWITSAGGSGGFPGGLNPIGGGRANFEQDVIVVKTKDAISVDDLRNDPNLKGPFTETKVGSYTLYQGTPLAFCRVTSKFILLGPTTSLNNVLARNKKPELSDNLRAAMKQADFTKPFALAIDSSGNTLGPNAREVAQLEMQWWAVQGSFGSDIDLTLMIQSQSERGTQEVKKKADEIVKALKAAQDMAGAFGQKMPRFYDEPKLSLSGSMFTAQVTFKTDGLIELIRIGKNAGNPQGGQPGRGPKR